MESIVRNLGILRILDSICCLWKTRYKNWFNLQPAEILRKTRGNFEKQGLALKNGSIFEQFFSLFQSYAELNIVFPTFPGLFRGFYWVCKNFPTNFSASFSKRSPIFQSFSMFSRIFSGIFQIYPLFPKDFGIFASFQSFSRSSPLFPRISYSHITSIHVPFTNQNIIMPQHIMIDNSLALVPNRVFKWC